MCYRVYKLLQIDLSKVIIVCDDIDTTPGKIRIRRKGGAGTHNGMKSVIYRLNSEEFPRVRVGVGMPEIKTDLINYVIGNVSDDDYKILEQGIDKASKGVIAIIKDGIDNAMNKYNV